MGHFYSKEGLPHFEVYPREAKKLGLLWSVTEIQKFESSPGLDVWKLNTAIQCADECPRSEDEDMKDYLKRIKKQMYEGGATGLGTRIHDAIEQCLAGHQVMDETHELYPYASPALDYIESMSFEIVALEKIVINQEEGYGGTADVIAKSSKGIDFVLDWKSTGTIPSKPYASHPEQISAYAVAEFGRERVINGEIWGANAYISTKDKDKQGLAKFRVHPYKPEQLAKAYQTFEKICELWRIRNDYDPRTNCGSN